jgi:hypothetical protein
MANPVREDLLRTSWINPYGCRCEMSEGSISRNCYVILSALSGIFCRVGSNVLSPPEALECHLVSNDLPCGHSLALGVT